MKKNILKFVVLALLTLVAGLNIYTSQKDSQLSDLAMENIEALASGEDFNGHPCVGILERKCCVCGNKHYTWAYSNGSGCETRVCSHNY